MKRILINIALLLGSLFFALVLVEIAVRIPAINTIFDHSPDRRIFQVNPNIGWSLRPNTNIIWNTDNLGDDDIKVEVQINSLGLRDTEHSYEKPPNTYRILILGDSFSEALQVPLEQAFPSRLEACLNEHLPTSVEVINGGVSAYSLGEQYLFYLNEGIKYDPDLVLIAVFSGNDLAELDRTDSNWMITSFGGYRFTLENDQLQKTWLSWDTPDQEEISGFELFLRRNSKLYSILTHPNYKFYWKFKKQIQQLTPETEPIPNPLPDWSSYVFVQDFANSKLTPPKLKEMWILYKAIFEATKLETTSNGHQLAVVVIPAKHQVHQSQLERQIEILNREYPMAYTIPWDMNEPNQTLINYFQTQNVPALDLIPYFREHELSGGYLLYFENDMHFNQDGHRLTSDVICSWLIQNEAIHLPRP